MSWRIYSKGKAGILEWEDCTDHVLSRGYPLTHEDMTALLAAFFRWQSEGQWVRLEWTRD